jgi:hypothetical protein
MVSSERTSQEWFAEAERCYVERHQGCAWCGGPYRVFRRQRGSALEYYCHCCDFRASHDPETGQCLYVPGTDMRAKQPETMFDIDSDQTMAERLSVAGHIKVKADGR